MSDDLQAELDNLRKTLEKQRAHSSQTIQEKEEMNKLLREQYERTQLEQLNQHLAADVNLSDPNWNQSFTNLFPGPETRKESSMATTPNPGEIVMTQSELEKKMKQTAREAIKEYEAQKAASAEKEAQTYAELNKKFMEENPEMVPHAPYLNDVFNTLANAPKDPRELYNYTLEAAKRSMAYTQQMQAQQAEQQRPRNPYSTSGLGSGSGSAPLEPVQRYQHPGQSAQPPQNAIFDPRPEEMRLQSAAQEAAERRKAYFKQGVGG